MLIYFGFGPPSQDAIVASEGFFIGKQLLKMECHPAGRDSILGEGPTPKVYQPIP